MLAGAKHVAISDNPSPAILAAIKRNVGINLPREVKSRAVVQGHEWGVTSDAYSRDHAGRFDGILCADCIWMDGEHDNLVTSMHYFLSFSESARIWVIAGFHTGRVKVAAFFKIASNKGQERPWDPDRNDAGEKEKWLVVAVLKRR